MTPAELINALPEAALLIGVSGEVVAANDVASDIFGKNLRGVSAKGLFRQPAFHAALDDVAKSRRPELIDIELAGRPARHFNVHIAPVGEGAECLVVLRDLTREQQIERMRSDFVANASHEIRTPLSAIIGSIETLQGAARNDEKARDKFLATMLVQARRMKRLVDDLLTLSRIELNEHVRPNARVDLADVIRQAQSNLKILAEENKVIMETAASPSTLVAGDADELLQVTQNLLENAIKYGGSGGRVSLSCESRSGYGLLSVRDFGKGIAEVHIPRLTERFYRVSTQESRARGGTGLGLAIVKHIISRHRGRLEIASSPGHGSVFTILIPLYSPAT